MSFQDRQIFLFDMTRHRSHLFFRYLSTHPDVQDLWHPFLPAFLFGPERMTQRTENPGRESGQAEWIPPSGENTYADATRDFLDVVKEARSKGKILVANEHTQMAMKQDTSLSLLRDKKFRIPVSLNPTVIPDEIYTNLTPVFVIRNPVFVVPSNYIIMSQTSEMRPVGEDWKMVNGMPIQRSLFDHFRERDNGKAPIVVDGDDVVWRTDDLRDSLSQTLDLDPAGLSSVWKAVPQNIRNQNPIIRQFLKTIDDSTGIECPSEQRPDPDLDRAYQK